MRLFVFVRLPTADKPTLVELDFENEKLASRYRRHVLARGGKKMRESSSSRWREKVIIEMPSEAVELETSGALRSFIVHFDSSSDARKCADHIWLPVKDKHRQLYIKQYWDSDEMVALERRLEGPTQPPPQAPEAAVPWSGRAGTPPAESRGSHIHN